MLCNCMYTVFACCVSLESLDVCFSCFSMDLFCAVVVMMSRSLPVHVGASDVPCLYAIVLTRLMSAGALFVVS